MDSRAQSDLPPDVVGQLVESTEARAYKDFILASDFPLRAEFGLDAEDIENSSVLSASGITESLLLNRVIGIGIAEPASDSLLDKIDSAFELKGISTYAIELSPAARPLNIPARLHARNYVPYKQTSMLYRPVRAVPVCSGGLCIRAAQPYESLIFADLTCRIFGFGEPFKSLIAATFSKSAWQHWLACDDGTPIACAMTWISGDRAWIGWVGTLTEHRGRGAQAALTIAQLDALTTLDVQWVTLETATGSRLRPSQSFRNYIKLGWIHAYNRTIYIKSSKRPA